MGGIERPVRIAARVAWSEVHTIAPGDGGEGEIQFQSGLEFANLPEPIELLVRHYLNEITSGKSPFPYETDIRFFS